MARLCLWLQDADARSTDMHKCFQSCALSLKGNSTGAAQAASTAA